MEKTIRTILDQAQNNNIRHGEHLKALADFYAKVLSKNFFFVCLIVFPFFIIYSAINNHFMMNFSVVWLQ
jgi:hypothetical protein